MPDYDAAYTTVVADAVVAAVVNDLIFERPAEPNTLPWFIARAMRPYIVTALMTEWKLNA